MPVQSKLVAGRARRPPPIPGTKSILKQPGQSRACLNGPTPYRQQNGPVSPSHVSVNFSVPRRPASNSPSSSLVDFQFENCKSQGQNDIAEQNDTGAASGYNRTEAGGIHTIEDEVFIESNSGRRDSGPMPTTIGSGQPEVHSPTVARPSAYSRGKSPSVSSVSGQALVQDCEDCTDWVNDVLRRNNLPLISDLRKSVGDGVTLPALLKIVSGLTPNCVKERPETKDDRVFNLLKCLTFLCKRGVDVSGLDPKDLEDGNLKECLLLVGNIRKHFEKSYCPEQNGHTSHVESLSIDARAPNLPPSAGMPGMVKIPGAVPTPFVSARDSNSNRRQSQPGSPTRKTAGRGEELIPGVLGPESHGANKPHSALISTTELGTNGVSQHGVEERRQHLAGSTPTRGSGRGILLRHPNAKGGAPVIQETSLPQGVTRAWTASPRHQANVNGNSNGGGGGASVEDRLRQLFNSANKNAKPINNAPQNNRENQARYNSGDGAPGLFHGGGSEVFDEGEILVVPPPKSRNSPDFDMMMLGSHGYGPGYKHHANMVKGQRPPAQGYVPSKPTDRVQGSRSEVILDRQPKPSPIPGSRQTHQPPVSHTIPGMMSGHGQNLSQTTPGMTTSHGHDNYAFSQDSPVNRYGRKGSNSQEPEATAKPPSPRRKAGSNDLRNAWKKLYGPHNQPPPYGASGTQMSRGDNLRSSYGPQSQSRGDQYSVKFSATPAQLSNRPVSAPAPAHMQVHFQNEDRLQSQGHSYSHDNLEGEGHSTSNIGHHSYDSEGRGALNTSTHRASPMGQSTSTQGHLEDSTSSGASHGQGPGQAQGHHPNNLPLMSSLDEYHKSNLSSPSSPGSPGFAIGPASKYPDHGSRPSSARKSGPSVTGPGSGFTPASPGLRHEKLANNHGSHQSGGPNIRQDFGKPPMGKPHNTSFQENSDQHGNMVSAKHARFPSEVSPSRQVPVKGNHSRGFSFDNSHDTSHDRSHDQSHDHLPGRFQDKVHTRSHEKLHDKSYDKFNGGMHDRSHDLSQDIQDRSIFEYEPSRSETSGSVTPPLPPLSPTNTPPDSPFFSDNSPVLPRSMSATNVSSGARVSDLIGGLAGTNEKRKSRRTSELQFNMERRPRGKKHTNKKRGFRSKGPGANPNIVEEGDTDSESNLSFDIDDTILTVESHDTEQPHPAGDILTSHEASALRQQLSELQTRYQDLQVKVTPGQGHQGHGKGYSQGPGPPPIGRQRRWSIGSSDTSSFRRMSKYKPGKQIHHRHHSKEFRNINKRFERLESHVVTLARSVAHLSSELRTHNTMVNDIEAVKKDLRELRDNPSRPFPSMLGSEMSENDRFRSWVPSLTNPKRVNKLTKFFGTEPPLLELFLKKLGYEKYVQNFETEHIGMIELPYMTEERMEKIGVPMGPRLRILQEAQLCFQQENMNQNVYLV